jgi:hypothetical protein
MTQIPLPRPARRGRETMTLLAAARPASLDLAAEPPSALRAADRLVAAQNGGVEARLLPATGDPLSGAPWRSSPPGRLTVLGRRPSPRLWAPVAAAATVTAIVITATTLAPSGHAVHGSSPGTVTAASALNEAAAAAARQPARSGQIFVSETEIELTGQVPRAETWSWSGGHTVGYAGPRENWPSRIRKGSPPPLFSGPFGQLTGPFWGELMAQPFLWLRQMPTTASRLLAYIGQATPRSYNPQERAANEFFRIGMLLILAPLQPAQAAALYRAAAMLPQMQAVRTHDLIGRAATEVYLVSPDDNDPLLQLALFFDPATGTALGAGQFHLAGQCQDITAETAVLASGYVLEDYPPLLGTLRKTDWPVAPYCPAGQPSAPTPSPTHAPTAHPSSASALSPSPGPTASPAQSPSPPPTPVSPFPSPTATPASP